MKEVIKSEKYIFVCHFQFYKTAFSPNLEEYTEVYI